MPNNSHQRTDLLPVNEVRGQIPPDVYLAQCDPVYDKFPFSSKDHVRRSLQEIWKRMGRDIENPFRDQLRPGGLAVIKPNWVSDVNHGGGSTECLVTHPSLIAYLVDWCAKAMSGHGIVVVGDAPIQGCNFDALLDRIGFHQALETVTAAYPDVELRVQDWRLTVMPRSSSNGKPDVYGVQELRTRQGLVQDDYFEADLGGDSFLEEIVEYADRFRVTMYQPSLMRRHHRPGTHQYLVRSTPFQADLFINVGKMKTHKKAGLTGALKNLVGINGHKEYLPHHIQGSYFSGGDAYCRHNYFSALADDIYDALWEKRANLGYLSRRWREQLHRLVLMAARLTGADRIDSGSWAGNETIWRTTLDLNHLLYFGQHRPKHILNVVDGIVAGEGDGPLSPSPRPLGMLLAGENPAHVDAVLARIIGYNIARIPSVYHALCHQKSRFGGAEPRDIPVEFVGQHEGTGTLADVPPVGLAPPRHWQRAMSNPNTCSRADRAHSCSCDHKG
jgi:uncharacterized protein (DUF362 family)